jgi:hypothetical protein
MADLVCSAADGGTNQSVRPDVLENLKSTPHLARSRYIAAMIASFVAQFAQ